MTSIAFILLIIFCAANIWVESRNVYPSVHWWNHPLSWYLYGHRYSWVQSLAYVGMIGAELIMLFYVSENLADAILIIIAVVGLAVVVCTANMHEKMDFPGRRKTHLVGAALAYGALIGFEFVYLWGTPSIWFPIGVVAVAGSFALWAKEAHSLDEKAVTVLLIAGLVPILGIPIGGV